MDYSWVKGFNYQPSYGGYGEQLWERFDPERVKYELGLGKQYFPNFNTVRIWLSWNYWRRDRKACMEKIRMMFQIAAENKLKIMPVLFNRWHSIELDYGGVYIEHFLADGACFDHSCIEFTKEVVGTFADSEDILIWDICNEPFSYINDQWENSPFYQELYEREFTWLKNIYVAVKELDSVHPVSVGPHMFRGVREYEYLDEISDVYLIHPYMMEDVDNTEAKEVFESKLDAFVQLNQKTQKGIIATETCWGRFDDRKRVELMEYTLNELKKRNMGWLAYTLFESYVADCHGASIAPTGYPEDLCFIRMDGTLRDGHEAFNKY